MKDPAKAPQARRDAAALTELFEPLADGLALHYLPSNIPRLQPHQVPNPACCRGTALSAQRSPPSPQSSRPPSVTQCTGQRGAKSSLGPSRTACPKPPKLHRDSAELSTTSSNGEAATEGTDPPGDGEHRDERTWNFC